MRHAAAAVADAINCRSIKSGAGGVGVAAAEQRRHARASDSAWHHAWACGERSMHPIKGPARTISERGHAHPMVNGWHDRCDQCLLFDAINQP
jgi:hypothetical protein